MWMPGIAHVPGVHSGDRHQTPVGVIRHRTYGAYGGDYSVGVNGVGFHFYAPKTQPGVQFYDTGDVAYHAYGANGTPGQDSTIGIEVEGTDDDPFTANQVSFLASVAAWITRTHSIPLVEFERFETGPVYYSSGPRRPRSFNGWRDHNNVDPLDRPEFRHTDGWYHADWLKVIEGAAGPPPAGQLGDTDVLSFIHGGSYHALGIRASDGHLLHSYWSGSKWVPEDLCVAAKHPEFQLRSVGGLDVRLKAQGAVNDIDIVGSGNLGEIVHFFYTSKGGWGADIVAV